MIEDSNQINSVVDHFFRSEYGKVISYLTSKFGTSHFEIIEDSVQEAIYMAMKTWPFKEIPEKPSAWIFRVANNKMIDKLRRLNTIEVNDSSEALNFETTTPNYDFLEGDLSDEILQMIFACCHPKLSVEHQLVLSLKILCGLGVKEIASSLVKKDAAIAKIYTRARHKFIQENIKLEVPIGSDIDKRLNVVLKVIYLLFNEGYKSSSGSELYKVDLCYEAIRLNHLLIDHDKTNLPNVQALMALMLLHVARFESRIGSKGEIVTLEFQDRTLWNNDLINHGIQHLNNSLVVGMYSEYHIQAAISALHCKSKSFEDTNWNEMLVLYDAMLKLSSSPVVKLNRLIPLAKVNGVPIAMKELKKIEASGFFNNYYLFFVIKGQFEAELQNNSSAMNCFQKAISLTENAKEKNFLEQKMKALD